MLRQFSDQLARLAPKPDRRVGDAGGSPEGANAAGAVPVSPMLAAEGESAENLVRMLVQIVSQVEGHAALLVALLDQNRWWKQAGSSDCEGFLTDHLHLPYGQALRLLELGRDLLSYLPETATLLCTGQISTHHAQSMCAEMTASDGLIDSLAKPETGERHSEAAGNPEVARAQADHAQGDHANGPATTMTADNRLGAFGRPGALGQPGSLGQVGASDRVGAFGQPGGLGWPGGLDPKAPGSEHSFDGDHAVFGPVVTGEHALLAQAVGSKPRDFRAKVKAHAQKVDPDARERDYAHQYAAQSLEIVAHHKGGYLITGYLDDEAGQTLKLVLGALRKQLPEETRVSSTPAHRNALALGMLARLDLEQVLTTTKNGSQLHLNVNVDYDAFLRAAAAADIPAEQIPSGLALEPAHWTDTRGPIPDSMLERMTCDSKIARIVFGPKSQILNAGDEIRIASAHQRRAVMARDAHCVYPTCSAPPGICDVHHVDEWHADGGPTDIENLALLCWTHHHHIHDQHLRLARNNGPGWHVLRRDGTTFARTEVGPEPNSPG